MFISSYDYTWGSAPGVENCAVSTGYMKVSPLAVVGTWRGDLDMGTCGLLGCDPSWELYLLPLVKPHLQSISGFRWQRDVPALKHGFQCRARCILGEPRATCYLREGQGCPSGTTAEGSKPRVGVCFSTNSEFKRSCERRDS